MLNNEHTGRQQVTEKITDEYQTDERLSRINEKTLAWCGICAIFYVVIRIIYVGFKGKLAVEELALLGVMSLCIVFSECANRVCTVPTVLGMRLNTEKTKKARLQRMLLYAADSAALAVFISILTLVFDVKELSINAIKGCLGELLVSFVVFFIITYIWTELKVRRYNKHIKVMEEDENNLDD